MIDRSKGSYWIFKQIQNAYKNIEEDKPGRKCNVLIVFDDFIAGVSNNKNLNQIVTSLFIRGRKLNVFSLFITKFYFLVSKDVRLNCTHFLMKISNQRQLQQIQINHSLYIGHGIFMNLYNKSTAKPYSFLVIDTTLASDNLLSFRKNIKTNRDNWW